MSGYVFKWKAVEVTLQQDNFTISDIGVILDCNFRYAKKIKLDIIKELREKGINYKETLSSKIPRDILFDHIERHYKNKLPTKGSIIVEDRYLKSKEEILD